MFVIEQERLVECLNRNLEELTLPEGISTISAHAFEKHTELRRVILPRTLKTIGEAAFAGCTALEEVVWNEGLKRLGNRCFRGCVSLRSAILPDSVASLRVGAFEGCTALMEVHLSEGLRRNVEDRAFAGCGELRRVNIPADVQQIGQHAFLDCAKLEEIAFGNADVIVNFGAFVGCESLNEAARAFIENNLFTHEKVDIRSVAPGARGRLSNFTARSFVLDGVACGSIEGVLQSLKCPDVEKQKEICALSRSMAQRAGREYDWKEKQELYWQGVAYPRLSQAYQQLLDRLYTAVYEQDESFRADLEELRGRELEHRMGKSDPKQTILTRGEFVSRLQKLSLQGRL